MTLRVQRVIKDPSARLKRGLRIGLGLGGFGALLVGQPIWALFLFAGCLGIHGAPVGAMQYPIAHRRAPSGPREASLLAMLPDRALRRVDASTYIVEPPPGASSRLEIWHALEGSRLSSTWFDLSLGPEPRVGGHADRVGPLLDSPLIEAPEGERISVRASWICWTTQPAQRTLAELVQRIHEMGQRYVEGKVRTAQAQEALRSGSPLLHALIMLADPASFELWPRAQSVRPSWRWLARDPGISREARAAAVRLLARSGELEEVLELLDAVGAAPARAEGAPERAVAHLDDDSHHVQIAALTILERVGTAAQQGDVVRCRAGRRAHRAEVKKAVTRALGAIVARHGEVEAGTLAVVAEARPEGGLGLIEASEDA